MASAIEKEAAVRIPEDVTMEILKKLPVKSLLRFRCVRKTWYSLISDPEFCNKLHQKRACVLICERSKLYSTVTIESLMNEKTSIQSAPIPLPWQPEDRFYTTFVGSCKGLVCVYYRTPDMFPHGNILMLWNPSTRKYTKLPSTSRAVPNWFDENTCGGFGYDESVDDYKFVWMSFKEEYYHGRYQVRMEFDVFSLKSNTWRSYDRCRSSDIILSSRRTFCQTGVLINGAIHWITRYRVRSSYGIRILSFDLASEEFTLLESPEECRWNHNSYLVSLSGCLCLCVTVEDSHEYLWMMKEYGVNSSWSKIVSIPAEPSTISAFGVSMFYPIFFSEEEGNIVAVIKHLSLERNGMREIMRLQVEEGEVVKAETLLSDIYYWEYVVMHMEESLVSLN